VVHGAVRAELETVKAHFKKDGLRWTQQRELIVETAFLTHEHFSAEQLLEMTRLRAPEATVHLATVYRTVQVLEEGGFVEGLEVEKGGRLFEHVLGHEHHDHVICLECGHISEFHDEVLEQGKKFAAKKLGFEMCRHSLRIYGSCIALARDGVCPNAPAAANKNT
jgi:Fur family ferric uptake transcriptional regulator